MTKIILSSVGTRKCQLSLVFVSGQKIRALNSRYLNRDRATDVLAFDFSEEAQRIGLALKQKAPSIVGEVIISTDAVIQNAREYKTSHAQELILYVIHGILHLSGYDDHKAKDVRLMRAKEAEILGMISNRLNKVIQS